MCVGVAGGILCARSMVRLIGGPYFGGCGLLMVLGKVLLFWWCCEFECWCANIVFLLMGGPWLGGCGLVASLGSVLCCWLFCCGMLFACLYFRSVFRLITAVGFGGMFPCSA